MSSYPLYDDTTTVNSPVPLHNAGDVVRYHHATYGLWFIRHVKFLNAVTYAAGQVCSPVANDGSTITNDITGGASTPWAVIFGGLALRVMTQDYWGYALIWGYYPTIKTSG